MKDIQARGERSPGAVQAAEVGGRGSTKERDEPLCSSPPPGGTPNRAGPRGGVRRKFLLLLQNKEAQGWLTFRWTQVCTSTRPRLHVERTEFPGKSGRRWHRLGLRLPCSRLKFLK